MHRSCSKARTDKKRIANGNHRRVRLNKRRIPQTPKITALQLTTADGSIFKFDFVGSKLPI
jgi:hypothetical protein